MSLLTLSIGLAQNFTLLLSLTFLYGLLGRHLRGVRARVRPVVTGSLFGMIATLGMLAPITVAPGVFIDGRAVIVALAGAFNGPLAAATAATLVGSYRLWLGGVGTLRGIGAIVTAVALGAAVHWRWHRGARGLGPRSFLLLGATLAVSDVLWTLTLPDADLRWRAFWLFVPSMGIFFPIEALLLGLLLSNLLEDQEHSALAAFSVEQCADAIFWVTRTGRFVAFNPAAARLCGEEPEQLRPMHPWEVGLVSTEAAWSVLWEELRRRGGMMVESDLRARDGASRRVEISGGLVGYAGTEYACLRVCDVSERRRREELLRETAERERRARGVGEVLRAASVALTETLDSGTVLERSLGWLAELVPSDAAAVLLLEADSHPVLRVVHRSARSEGPGPGFSRALADEHAGVREVLLTRRSVVVADRGENSAMSLSIAAAGARSWLGVPLVVGGEVIGLYSVEKAEPAYFTPEHVRFAEALAAPAAAAIKNAQLFEQVRRSSKQLEALSRRLTRVQEEERRFIARELHDEIGQVVTALKLAVEMSVRAPADATGSLRQVEALAKELLQRIRELSLDLRPTMLDDLGLLPALLWHCTSRTGLRVSLKHTGMDRRFDPEVETAVYRIVQEALTNVARHAGVDEATVRLWADENGLGVRIEDKGPGFDARAALGGEASSGIAGMRERARLLGGDLVVESAPGVGTCVTGELPLRSRERGAAG